MFERETRREKIIDARHRELKLKERTKTTDKVSIVMSVRQMLSPVAPRSVMIK